MASLEALKKFETEDAKKFIHGVINNICEKEGVHYEDYAQKLSLSEYSQLKTTLGDLVKKASREGMEQKKLTENLTKLNVSQELGGVIAECIWVRRDEIREQLVQDTCSLSHSSLEDYDWTVKLVLASDKMGSVQEPLLSMNFHLDEGGKKRTENIELSQDELAKLISSLEAANKVVLQLRT